MVEGVDPTQLQVFIDPQFIELKPLLLLWTYGILGVCVFLAILQLSLGPIVPAALVIVAVYGTLIFLLIRALVRFVRSRIPALKTR